MAELMYREALNQALREEMDRDANVFLMGEEVGRYQGAFKVSQGLLERFGSARVVDAPISELGFTGLGVGAAMVGLRPVIEIADSAAVATAAARIAARSERKTPCGDGRRQTCCVDRRMKAWRRPAPAHGARRERPDHERHRDGENDNEAQHDGCTPPCRVRSQGR